MGEKHPNKAAVYVLEKSPYGDEKQIVLHVTDEFRDGYICFDDTNRGHMIKGKIIEWNQELFVFIDDKKREWNFREVSIKYFEDELYEYVIGGDEITQKCNTTEELWEYFKIRFPI